MIFKSISLRNILDKWPGKNRFGIYRFLPIFFVLGAALEFSMIKWTVGETNFYNTFKKRRAHDIVQEKIATHKVIKID
uniref:Small integral membrane protein 4 n=1 Tax=Corethrella appendiculata TaxID=1370023 RepID=U5EUY7_9DIPT